MEAMNAIGFAPHDHGYSARVHRVETVTLASSISIVALLAATFLHVVLGVHETPLVIGTLVLASIAGWINAYLPATAGAPCDGGSELVDDGYDDVDDWLDAAA